VSTDKLVVLREDRQKEILHYSDQICFGTYELTVVVLVSGYMVANNASPSLIPIHIKHAERKAYEERD
jgi:hypothetical protein